MAFRLGLYYAEDRFSAEISALQATQSRRGSHRREVSLPRHYGSKESKEAHARLIAEHGDAPRTTTPRADISDTELVARYWEWAAAYYDKKGRPSGHQSKVRQALRVLRELYGSTSAASFGPLAMRAIQKL